MTKARFHRLLDHWVAALDMTHWRWDVVLGCEELNDDQGASIEVHEDYDLATLHFNKDWSTWDAEEASRNIVHELLHAAGRDMRLAFKNAVAAGGFSADATVVLNAMWEHAEEGAIERLASAFVGLAQQ